MLDDFCAEFAADRPAAVKAYLDRYYNIDVLGGTRVTDQAWQNSFHVAIGVSAAAALGCALAWREDFRADLARISVPVLIVQGSQDRVMPLAATGNPLAAMLGDARLVVIPDGPHAITWTHAAQVNQALLGFLRDLLPQRSAGKQGQPAAAAISIPVLIIGQFAMLAIIPVAVVVTITWRHKHMRRLRV